MNKNLAQRELLSRLDTGGTPSYETACAPGIENEIDVNLPWSKDFDSFGPRYRREVMQSNLEDLNLRDGALDEIRERALKQRQLLRNVGAPSGHAGPPARMRRTYRAHLPTR
ncbi:hypothetical protein B0H19DRAFT_119794 [Mycena capillaripes]|nr:hypothetical protein B0H19DRAFT_119794 [Mycena capillaripes]